MKKLLQSLFILLFVASSAMAQNRTITGTVTSKEDGLPLPGVSVKVKGTNVGVSTGADGRYSLSAPANASALEFTSIGYFTQSVNIGSGNTYSVSLAPDSKALTEVVVTGYTSTLKDRSVSATSTVSAKEINNIPVGSIDQILQGRAPGLLVMAGSGQPGAAARVTVRGAGSINGSTTPLYVLDGVPIESSVFQTLNPNDFESVNVLKDASATSLYGSRGSNGVILISSKKGKAGNTIFTYNGQGGISTRTSANFDMLTSAQLLTLQEAAKVGPGWTLSPLNPAGVATTKARRLDSLRNLNTNWDDIFFRNGKFQSHQVSASGGNEKTRFYTSLSYYDQEGTTERSDLRRYNFRLNLDHNSGKFAYSVQSAVGQSKNNYIESEGGVALANPFAAVYLAFPWEYPYDNTGKIITSGTANQYSFPIYDARLGSNALDRYTSTSNFTDQLKGTVSGNASYEIFKGLKAKTALGLDYRETNSERSIYPGTYPGGLVTVGQQGSFALGNTQNFQLISTSGLSYLNVFNGKHEVEGSLLYEVIKERYQTYNYTGYGINPKLLNTPAGITPGTLTNALIPVVGGSRTRAAFASIIGIGRYTYDQKYTIQASYRRDGSSRLPEANRFHDFYSVGLNWDAKKENFLANFDFINQLRIRASYGTAANGNGVSDFGYIATYGNISYAGLAGVAPTSPGNANYDWEYSKNLNIGFDTEFWNNRIALGVDVYNRETNNLLISQQLSRTAGFSSLNVNAGKVRNRGIETSLTFNIIRSRDIDLSFNGNISYNDNEVTSLGQVNEFEQGTSIIRVGLPLGSHYMVPYAGVDPANGNPLYRNKDGSTTTTYTSATQSVPEFGTYNAPTTGGFGFDFRYKGFDISTFFNFMQGYSRFNNERYFLTNVGFISAYNQSTAMLDYWKTPGQITDIPRFGTTRQFSGYDIQDASFLRFRNARIGYTFPKEWMGKVKYLSSVRIYAQGQNLYTWTKWQGFDPEDNNNIAQFEYPASRQFTFGLDVRF